jgi:hypothetical protein
MPDPVSTKTDEAGQPKSGPQSKTQWVVSARTDDKVVLWEVDAAHPGGEAYVAGKVPAEVAPTAAVNAALRQGELRDATPEEISKRKSQLGAPAAVPKGPWE